MTDSHVVCWREAVRVCLTTSGVSPLARHLARLPEGEREMLLKGIGSEGLRAAVSSLLRRQREQLALV